MDRYGQALCRAITVAFRAGNVSAGSRRHSMPTRDDPSMGTTSRTLRRVPRLGRKTAMMTEVTRHGTSPRHGSLNPFPGFVTRIGQHSPESGKRAATRSPRVDTATLEAMFFSHVRSLRRVPESSCRLPADRRRAVSAARPRRQLSKLSGLYLLRTPFPAVLRAGGGAFPFHEGPLLFDGDAPRASGSRSFVPGPDRSIRSCPPLTRSSSLHRVRSRSSAFIGVCPRSFRAPRTR